MQTSNIEKKAYAQPQCEIYQIKAASIICGSQGPTTNSTNEEFGLESSDSWFI